MPVGFGVSTETARSVVKNFRKQRKGFNAPEKTLIRHSDGTLSTKSKIRIDSKEDLLVPPLNLGFAWTSKQPKEALVIDFTGRKYNQKIVDWDGSSLREEGRKEYLDVRVGNYRLNAYKEHHNNMYNFTLTVLVGNSFVFDARNIREHIIEKFNEDVYNTWKKNLNENIFHAELCVELSRQLTDRVIASPITSDSSRRLCKRAGFFMSNDEAFLLPKKYKY